MVTTSDIPIRLDIQNPDLLRWVNRRVMRVVHERDHFTCRCCGFRSVKYQQIINQNENWRDIDALATVCIFCQQCFLLDEVGHMRSGVLISLPHTEQTELNRLAVEIYVARISGDENWTDKSRACLDYLISLRNAASKLITDNPVELARKIRDCKTEAERELVEKETNGIRLLPLDRRIIKEAELEFNQFPQILAFWRSSFGLYASKNRWFPILKQFAEHYL